MWSSPKSTRRAVLRSRDVERTRAAGADLAACTTDVSQAVANHNLQKTLQHIVEVFHKYSAIIRHVAMDHGIQADSGRARSSGLPVECPATDRPPDRGGKPAGEAPLRATKACKQRALEAHKAKVCGVTGKANGERRRTWHMAMATAWCAGLVSPCDRSCCPSLDGDVQGAHR